MAERSESMGVDDYLSVLRHGWIAILLLGLAGTGAGYVVTAQKTPSYSSSVELVLTRPSGGVVVSADVGPFQSTDGTFLHTQRQVLQSELLLTRAAQLVRDAQEAVSNNEDNEGVAVVAEVEAPHSFAEPLSGFINRRLRLRGPVSLADHLAGRDLRSLAVESARSVSVSSLARTRILVVRTSSASPFFAAALANSIAGAYSEYVEETFASSAQTTFLLLQKQAEEARADVRKTAQRVLAFKKMTEIDALTTAAKAPDPELAKTQELVRERLAASDPEIAALREELARTDREIAATATRYKAKHPAMQDLATRRALTENRIADLSQQSYLRWQRSHEQERDAVEFSMLERDLEATRHLHDLLVEKMKEVDFSKQAPQVTVRVLRKATPSMTPTYPKPSMNVSLGAISGILLGLLVTFLRAFARSSLVSLNVPEETMPAPVVGRLTQIADTKKLNAFLRGEDVSFAQLEAVRALRTSLLSLAGVDKKVILITSPDRGDGKSTVSLALARSIASLGKRVVLVDMDLRRGVLHRMFEGVSRKGLAEILDDDEDVKPAEIAPCMSFLSCGRSTNQPSELLTSARMGALLVKLREQHDVVILDSPPLLPVTDAALLAPHADVRLLVVRSLQTHRKACDMAAAIMGNLGYSIDGVVLNGIRGEEIGQYGYYRRYYGGYYGRDQG